MAHTWNVQIQLFSAEEVRSDEPLTTAEAELTTSGGTTLRGFGRARKDPHDPDIPEIGEELAAARALRDLADRLLRATSDDLAAIEHHKVHVHP
ncbi:dsRBD fold-containing protein [Georgenia sp. SYP-B2076]|uniref:dsRBD fold-containing protein n=1 Tax=Georgenia sp. SYP-B2076 TaxID=2495881 RepID=UPI000F8C6035|nr:dsRBD fold-containing protein [Georgenia sp. SYP-B2076]